MANVYVRSGAAGAGTGADWANAYTTLNAALTAKAAGDVFWVAGDHAESTNATVAHTSPGTVSAPCFIYCANHLGTVPPVSADLLTTATVYCINNNGMSFLGWAYCRGITFLASQSGGSNAAALINIAITSPGGGWYFDNCTVGTNSTSASAISLIGGVTTTVGYHVTFNNTKWALGNVAQGINLRSVNFSWRNTASALTGSIPTGLFKQSGLGCVAELEGVDFSLLDATSTLIMGLLSPSHFLVKDCKMGASSTLAATPTSSGGRVFNTRSDSGATNYRCEKYNYRGTETTETTIIRTGGASDGTPQSRKIVTTANSNWLSPFAALPLSFWNAVVGTPITVTLRATSNLAAGAFPNTDDIWLEAEYPGSTLTPLGSFASNTKADNLAAGSAYTSDGAAWAGSPAGGVFSMSVTFTPQMAGPITLSVRAAKASTTFYVDPKVTVS